MQVEVLPNPRGTPKVPVCGVLNSASGMTSLVVGRNRVVGNLTIKNLTRWYPATKFNIVLLLVVGNSLLHDGSETLDQTLDRPCSSITQGTNGVALDLLGELKISSISLTVAWPETNLSIIFCNHVVPSLHGVHWPQDSCL